MYSVARLLFVLWLVHPSTQGAAYLYEQYIWPVLAQVRLTFCQLPAHAPSRLASVVSRHSVGVNKDVSVCPCVRRRARTSREGPGARWGAPSGRR